MGTMECSNIELNGEVLKPILSPINEDLILTGLPAKEGLSQHTQCEIIETRMSWQDLADQFECEANTTKLPEHLKHQRDVDENDSRVKGMRQYLSARSDTVFPSITIFVNKVGKLEQIDLLHGDTIQVFSILANSHRLICDGQGRTTCIKAVLREHPEWASFTIGAKIIVTNTDSLFEASVTIRQVFSDLNGQTKKPDNSLSMYFDTSRPFSRLMKEVIEAELKLESKTVTLRSLIALNGKIKDGQLWTLKQFSDAFPLLFGQTPSSMNKSLDDADVYAMSLDTGVKFFQAVLSVLPVDELLMAKGTEFSKMHQNSMFTKALFSKALGYLGRSLYEEAIESEKPIDWNVLDKLKGLPLNTLDDQYWLKNQVCWQDENTKGKVTKIHKSSDKKIARLLCQSCRVFPTMAI